MAMTTHTKHQDDEGITKARLDYVQRCFINVHELNRMLDQKANFLLASVGLITAALGVIATAALNRKTAEDWQLYLKTVAFTFLLVYLFLAFWVVLITTKVFRARTKLVSPNTHAPGLLFPLILLNRYHDEIGYKNKVSVLSYDDIIEDYSHQIIEVSNIYSSKQHNMNQATAAFQYLVWLWITSVFLLLTTAFLLPT